MMSSRPVPSAQEALSAYQLGHFDQAIIIQRELIAENPGPPRVEHYMIMAMMLFERGMFAESLAWLEKACNLWPSNAEIAENMGVLLSRLNRWEESKRELERAIALGSDSLNVLDCLCHCHGQLNELDFVQRNGRRVLEEKNRRSLLANRRSPLPSTPPPRFDATRRGENVISYGLWGDNPRYLLPLLENLRIAPHLFPSWTIRVYHDRTATKTSLDQLRAAGAELVDKSNGDDPPFYTRLSWRFEVANDPTVRRFLVRDADSLLTVKERVAVDEWLGAGTYFHLMRDFHTHTDLILAGMWGGVANILPNIREYWSAYRSAQMQGRTADQRFLGEMIWPTVSQSCTMHDSVFTGCLGSIPFPPYGDLPPGHHIGQNAYIHFRQK
jgi:tetratricopeptide (TPR) repeat protein